MKLISTMVDFASLIRERADVEGSNKAVVIVELEKDEAFRLCLKLSREFWETTRNMALLSPGEAFDVNDVTFRIEIRKSDSARTAPVAAYRQDNLSDMIDAAIKKHFVDTGTLADAIQKLKTYADTIPQEPQPVAERTWDEVLPYFLKYQRGPMKIPLFLRTEDAFLAGYNAALKNESCLRNRPSENAEGGQSGSEDPNDMPLFNIGFKGADLSRLNPVVRKFFESFAVANDAEFVGLAFLPNGRCVAELKSKTDIRHIELKGWLGMMWPEIADVVEPATPYQVSAHPASVHQILDESGQGSGMGVEDDFDTAMADLKATLARFLRSDLDRYDDRAARCKSKLIAMGLDPKVSAITTMEELHTFRAWLENEIRMEADL